MTLYIGKLELINIDTKVKEQVMARESGNVS